MAPEPALEAGAVRPAPRKDHGFEAIDRRLAASFLALAAALMVLVLFVGAGLYAQHVRSERERLTELIAHSMGPSFQVAKRAGKYRMQQLADQMREGHLGLEYIRVVDMQGAVLAQSGDVGLSPGADDANLLRLVAEKAEGSLEVLERDGFGSPVTEAAYVLRGGYQGEWQAVLRVGVRGQTMQAVLLEAAGGIGGVLALLLLLTWPIVRSMSRSLARPIRALARDFDGVMKHSPLFITIEDAEGRIEKSSATFRAAFGIPEGERPKTTAVFPPEVFEAAAAAEVRLDVAGQSRVLVTSRFPVSFDEEGQVLREGLIATDVTAWRETQTERDQLVAAVENAEELVLVSRPRAGVVYANRAYLEFSGFAAHRVLGRDPTSLLFGETFASETPRTAVLAAIESAERFRGRVLVGRDGADPVLCDLLVSPIDSGEARGFVWMVRDVSRESEIEMQLRQAQKMEAIGRLAGGIAHDFNNLLTVINGATSLLLDESLGEDEEANVQMIEQAGKRAAELTRQLLAFSRRQVLSLQQIDLNQVVRGAMPLLESAVGRDVQLHFRPDEELWSTRADVGQIEQVLMNLAINAKDALEGIPNGRVDVRTENAQLEGGTDADGTVVPAGDYVVLSVSDTGQGMDEKTRASIFEPFFTTKGTGKGTGLGLATVHGIVRQSGGHVFVFSTIGVGTTFRIALPRVTGAAHASPTSSGEVAVRPGNGQVVLVVDDDDGTREIIIRMLERGGFEPRAVNGGEAALEWLGKSTCDVMLTDIVMPKMNGVELQRRVHEVQPTLPVVFMSGYSASAVDLGVEGTTLVSKPPSMPALFLALHDAMRVGEEARSASESGS